MRSSKQQRQPQKPVKFFCESCGGTVSAHDIVCPHCGKLFSAVRCPRCSYSGLQSQFLDGCPRCGYEGRDRKAGFTASDKAAARHRIAKRNPNKQRPPVPLFTLVLLSLVGAFLVLAIVYTKL